MKEDKAKEKQRSQERRTDRERKSKAARQSLDAIGKAMEVGDRPKPTYIRLSKYGKKYLVREGNH